MSESGYKSQPIQSCTLASISHIGSSACSSDALHRAVSGHAGGLAHSQATSTFPSVAHMEDFIVATYNLGLQKSQWEAYRRSASRSQEEAQQRTALVQGLLCMFRFLIDHAPDVLLLQEMGDHTEGTGMRQYEVRNDLAALLEKSTVTYAVQEIIRSYDLVIDAGYWAWVKKARAKVVANELSPMCDLPGQAWRCMQVLDLEVPAGGLANSQTANVRLVNIHFVSGQKTHSSGQNRTLNYQTRCKCIALATARAVRSASDVVPHLRVVAGDFNIDTDDLFSSKYGHATEGSTAWLICSPGNQKDFLLASGATGVDNVLPRTGWKTPAHQRLFRKPHWPVGASFTCNIQPQQTTTMARVATMESLLKRARTLVDEAKQNAEVVAKQEEEKQSVAPVVAQTGAQTSSGSTDVWIGGDRGEGGVADSHTATADSHTDTTIQAKEEEVKEEEEQDHEAPPGMADETLDQGGTGQGDGAADSLADQEVPLAPRGRALQRFARSAGPHFLWEVQTLDQTLAEVVEVLSIRDKWAQAAWDQLTMEDRMLACEGEMDDATKPMPPDDFVLPANFVGRAWKDFVARLEERGLLTAANKRQAAGAYCHKQFGDKRVLIWLLCYNSHAQAQNALNESAAIRKAENEAAGVGPPQHGVKRPVAGAIAAARQRHFLKVAEIMRYKLKLASPPDGWCPCGAWGPRIRCAWCNYMRCRQNCQHVAKPTAFAAFADSQRGTSSRSSHQPDPEKPLRFLMCQWCAPKGQAWTVEGRLRKRPCPPRCEAYISIARSCPRAAEHECHQCNRWLCNQCCTAEVPHTCVVCPVHHARGFHPIKLVEPGPHVWSSLPQRANEYLNMTEAQFMAELEQADAATMQTSTGGRLLGDTGFESSALHGRGVVFRRTR